MRAGRKHVWFPSSCSILYFFLCLQTSLKPSESADGDGPCKFDQNKPDAVCEPCSKDQWIELVGEERGQEKITNENQSCYNNDPVSLHFGDPTSVGIEDLMYTISQGKFRKSKHLADHFQQWKEGFFRLAYVDSSGGSSQDPAVDNYLDPDSVKDYYTKEHNGKMINADFQLIEFPGKTAEIQKRSRECKKEKREDVEVCTNKYFMLDVQRDNGKVEFYPCNAREGINVVAVAILTRVDESKLNLEVESRQKIWLSYGRKSIYNHYNEPMYLPDTILEEMAKTEGDRCLAKDKYEDLRTVMDFTFTKHRLLLGMKCGVVVVTGLDRDALLYNVSILLDETGEGANLFPGPVNRISASTCCEMESCSADLVAAYSFDPERDSEDDKFIYISFDLGTTFEKKILASQHSPVNLIKGLYKLYEKWSDYYDILNDPDERDLEEDGDGLTKLRSMPLWDVSITQEKERLFALGKKREKKEETILKEIVRILEERVPKRRKRMQEKGVDIDKTPEWANIILNKRRKEAGWNVNWTDESCDDIPECTEKFENDKAVNWLLQNADIDVKTPKRNENEPFCKEITSILVLPEENHVMTLCEIGYGKNKQPEPKNSTSEGRVGEEPEYSDLNEATSFPVEEITGTDEAPTTTTEEPTTTTTTEKPTTTTTRPPAPGPGDDLRYFALFHFAVKRHLPIMYPYRISTRIIACKLIKNTMNPNEEFVVQPEVIRIPGSATILIVNCDGVIFLSTNFGNTLFNSAFYFRKDIVREYCLQSPEYSDVSVEGCMDKKESEDPTYLRSLHLCALNVPPLIIADRSASIVLMTFGKFYARGAIAYNLETRFIVGETLRHLPYERRFENDVFPVVNTVGETILAVVLKKLYSIPSTIFEEQLYRTRPSIRLVQLPFQYYNELKYCQNENLAMCADAATKRFGFSPCRTISFSVSTRNLSMDINQKETIRVRAKADDQNLPLWIFSSNEKSVEVKAIAVGDKFAGLNYHDWDVEIKTKPNNKSEEESLVDSFFGSDYNKLHDYSTQISLVNTPTVRCHVQPSSTVSLQIGCEGKRLVAHEDKHRPQCGLFRKNFQYELKKGQYDPHLANFWIHQESSSPASFVQLGETNGSLKITYDYSSWGCPLEPFRSEDFSPDLRIIPAGETDSSKATPFVGKFVLIELFGAKGFSYKQKVKDVKGCRRAPQSLKEQIHHWVLRQRLFTLASERLTFPDNSSDIGKTNITGNKVLKNDAVWQQINIWNRANFLNCDGTYESEDDGGNHVNSDLPEKIKNRPYEVMDKKKKKQMTEGIDEAEIFDLEEKDFTEEEDITEANLEDWNFIQWDKKNHQRVYLFLAVAVDDYGSLCNYQTVFAVSIKKRGEMDNLTSILLFLLFVLIWVVLIVGGYFVRKRMLRQTFLQQGRDEKLEQAAWLMVYRYEKLIHGRSMNHAAMSNLQLENDVDDGPRGRDTTGMSAVAKSAHDKRKAELRIKKTHILAQEQAKHEKLQKIFQRQ